MNRKQQLLKWSIIFVIFAAVCFWNRDSLPAIWEQVRSTSPVLLLTALVFSLLYYLLEGKIIALLGSREHPGFRYRSGVAASFFCEFYRMASLGSLTAVSEIFFLHTKGIPAARGTGMYLVQYGFQRLSIALLGIAGMVVVLLRSPQIMAAHAGQIVLSYLLTFVLVFFLLFAGLCRNATSRLFCLLERALPLKARSKNTLFRVSLQADTLQQEVSALFREKKRLCLIFMLSVLKMVCRFLIPAVLLFDPRQPERILPTLALTCMVFVLSGVIPAPGGLGSLVFVFLLLFSTVIPSETAASVMVLFRLLISVVPFLIGSAAAGMCRYDRAALFRFAEHAGHPHQE